MPNDTELKDEAAKVEETIEATPTERDTLLKAIRDGVEALEKGDFGDTAKAHNGNEYDKSSPKGASLEGDGYKSSAAEEQGDGGRAKRSTNKGKTTSPAAPTALLGKGAIDEEEEAAESDESDEEGDGDDDKKKAKRDKENEAIFREEEADREAAPMMRSRAAVTEDSFYKGLTEGDGADEFKQVVDASDAIAHLTDVMAKSMAAIARAVKESDETNRRDIAAIKKSLSAVRSAESVLLKSAAATVERLEDVAAAPAERQPSSGVALVVNAADKATTAGEAPSSRTILAKSIYKAMSAGTIDRQVGGDLLVKVDTQPIADIWETLPESIRTQLAA